LIRNLWRISGFNSLSGEGGLRYSARWHTAGHRVVYLAESPAGALIEHLVHLELNEKSWPRLYDLMQIAVPDGMEVETLSLPAGDEWKRLPGIARSLGDEWLRSKRTALAPVPSAIMPNTWNFLLNPDHAEAAKIRIIEIARAEYDPRLFPKD
jgi:RES domain-containing protein